MFVLCVETTLIGRGVVVVSWSVGDGAQLDRGHGRGALSAPDRRRVHDYDTVIPVIAEYFLLCGINLNACDFAREILPLHVCYHKFGATTIKRRLRVEFSQKLLAHVELLGKELLWARVAQMLEACLLTVVLGHSIDKRTGDILIGD